MAVRRQAWCPRCDELRPGRAGGRCPACPARLVEAPAAAVRVSAGPDSDGGTLRTTVRQRLRRLRAVLPALRAAALALGAVALVTGSFVAGRATRSSAQTQAGSGASASAGGSGAAVASTSTQPGPGLRELGWHASSGQVTVTLRRIENGADFSTVTLGVAGLAGIRVAAFNGLRIEDGRGNDLSGEGTTTKQPINSGRIQFEQGGGTDYLVQFNRTIAYTAVARVDLQSLTTVQMTTETAQGTLTDAAMRRDIDRDGQANEPGTTAGPCSACPLSAGGGLKTIKVAGATYRHGKVVLLFAPADPAHWSMDTGDGDAEVDADNGQVSSDTQPLPGGGLMVTFAASSLALVSPAGNAKMPFRVQLFASRQGSTQGPWRIDQNSGSAGAGG